MTDLSLDRPFSTQPKRFRPAAPAPLDHEPTLREMFSPKAAKNLLTVLPRAAYQVPYRRVRMLHMLWHGVSDPDAIKRVLLDNAQNYQRPSLIRRAMRPTVGEGLLTAEAGGWLNEWARRTRHIACALLVISQHLSDFANPQGQALLRNSVLRLLFHTSHDELTELGDALGLHGEDLAEISALQTRKGEHSTCFVDSEAHGRAVVRVLLSDLEYWACSADPERDQPLRALALAETGGDPWAALARLADPSWHYQRARELAAERAA